MQIYSNPKLLRSYISEQRIQGKIIGLVPTMGALHQGHLELVRESLRNDDITICSIYVNPVQFNDQQDLKNYPRDLDRDLEFLKRLNCDAVFCPNDEVMYPSPPTLSVNFGELENVMEGRYRPGHFSGVAIVVSKLFNIVRPDRAYFGEKDWQQLIIIKQLVEDLNFPLEIVGVPIFREVDGLAMSSRNKRLSEAQRNVAGELYQTLLVVKQELEKHTTIEKACKHGSEYLEQFPLIQLEYLEVVDANTLDSATQVLGTKPLTICLAAFLGEVRLIDNMQVFDSNPSE